MSNPTANNARAWISFLDYNSQAEILKINGRWTTKREPVNYQTNQVDLGEALIVPREVLTVGEEFPISIAVKEAGKDSFFGFNNESYLHNKWQNPDYELTEKTYIVNVKVSSEGKEWNKKFLILNSGRRLGMFKLQMI